MKRKKDDDSDPIQQMQTILYEEIHRVRELVTIRKPFKREVSFNDDRKIPKINVHMPLSDRKILITYSGMIACGCDLDKISLTREGNNVKIFVPHSRILDCYADVKSFKIAYQDTGLLAKDFKIEEQNALIKADLENQQREALQNGLLAEANEEVRQMLANIIERRGLNQSFNLQIVFQKNGTSTALSTRQNPFG